MLSRKKKTIDILIANEHKMNENDYDNKHFSLKLQTSDVTVKKINQVTNNTNN